MKKSLLTAAVTVALGLSSTSALAVIDLDTVASDAATYASEIDVENMGALTGASLNTTVQLGFGFASGNTSIYARFDLTGGTFGNAITGGQLSSANATSVSKSAGGTAGSNFVVFNIQAGGVNGLADTEVLNLALGTIGVVINTGSSNVSLRYRLYTDPAAASQANANTLKDTVGEQIIAFQPGLTLTPVTNTSTASVSVAPAFTQFVDNTAPQPTDVYTARIGQVTLGVNALPVLDATGVALADAGTILDPTTSITVTGDFSAVDIVTPAGGVWLDAAQDCSAPISSATLAADKQSAEMVLPNTNGSYYVCYMGDGATAFAEETYKVAMNPVAKANYLASKINFNDLTVGYIKRDGTELQATFMSNASAQVSRFIFINNGSSDAPITNVKVVTNTGVTYTPGSLTLPKMIPAGGRLAIQASEILTAFSSGSNAGVIFSVGATNANIQGTYQYKMNNSDVQTVVQMVRPGTN